MSKKFREKRKKERADRGIKRGRNRKRWETKVREIGIKAKYFKKDSED